MRIRTKGLFATCLVATAALGCSSEHAVDARAVTSETVSAPDPHAGLEGFHTGGSSVSAEAAEGPVVTLGRVRLTSPEGWKRKAPRSEFIQAEFALPRSEGDAADGRLTVTTAGGSVEDNVSRWRGQFSQQLDKESQEQLKVQDVEVTLVDFTGTYNDQRGNLAQLAESPNYRMLGAIFSVDGALHFIKLYGPEQTVAAHAEEFRGFVQSLQLEGAAE